MRIRRWEVDCQATVEALGSVRGRVDSGASSTRRQFPVAEWRDEKRSETCVSVRGVRDDVSRRSSSELRRHDRQSGGSSRGTTRNRRK